MPEFVVDASAAAKMVLDEAHSRAFRKGMKEGAVLGHKLHASTMLGYEVADVISENMAQQFDRGLAACLDGIEQHDVHRHLRPFVNALTAYDASYVALAVRLGAALITYDERLADAARRQGVKVLSP